MGFGFVDILLIIVAVVAVIFVGLYFFIRWSQTRMYEQQKMINATTQPLSIYVIDKKRDKITNVSMPKAVMDQMPKRATMVKMNFVMAKVGPQIVTFICDKAVYNSIPLKKNVKVDASGIYITSMKGMKSKEELKAIAKAKKKEGKK